ncbi:MAG: cytochrome c3 family protein [Bacillota bacterium]
MRKVSRAGPSIYRLYLILVIVLMCAPAFAAPAFAWTHGQFSATTDACAGCHVAHAAQMPKLLKQGPTQTHFCFLCHGDGGTSAPYDIKDGITVAGSTYRPSTAGGFVRQWVDDGDNILEAGELKPVTSRHNVQGFVYGDESGTVQDTTDTYHWIPGGSNQFSGSGFVCGSCHDPHAGGRTPDIINDPNFGSVIWGNKDNDGRPNPRLLRQIITVQDATYTNLALIFQVATVGTFTYSATGSAVYQVTNYWSGSTEWCGACHNKLKYSDADVKAGDGQVGQYFSMWRHPMDVHVAPVLNQAGTAIDMDRSLATGTPLETEKLSSFRAYKVACLTCHRAHSTTAAIAGWATSWPRDATDPATGKALGDTSALLRMDSRGVCYNCHRAGQYNCQNDSRFNAAQNTNCSFCHPHTGGGAHPMPGTCGMCHPDASGGDLYN